MKKVLLIEDDATLAGLIELHLKDQAFEVTHTAKGLEGQKLALNEPFDLIILDLMLPDSNGMDICQNLRKEQLQTPVIMLTAKSEEIDKVLGLESGADDYITKPFSVRELIARVKAVLRRTGSGEKSGGAKKIQFDGLEIDRESRVVLVSGKRVELTPKEFDLLFLLASHPGRSYSREELLNLVWGYQFDGYDHTVNSHMNRLRAKIETSPSAPKYILTTWGIGYRFNDSL